MMTSSFGAKATQTQQPQQIMTEISVSFRTVVRRRTYKPNKEKYEYKATDISYLGHVISKEGLKADPKKIDAVQHFQTPENIRPIGRDRVPSKVRTEHVRSCRASQGTSQEKRSLPLGS